MKNITVYLSDGIQLRVPYNLYISLMDGKIYEIKEKYGKLIRTECGGLTYKIESEENEKE